jgi:23S rRNA pseudouridine955/2504/2580 synthase
VGDDKYGNDQTRDFFKQNGFSRMFLHAQTLSLVHPSTGEALTLEAPVPALFEKAHGFVRELKDESE